MLDDIKIMDFNGNVYSKDNFLKELKNYNKDGFNVFIGSDSRIIRRKIIVVTAICFHKLGSSGKIFYIKEIVNKKEYPNLKTRMFLEAYKSLDLAMSIEGLVSTELEIHLDVGSTARSKTCEYEKELQSLIRSQGYNCAIKPDSWASSAVADKIMR